MQLRPSRSRRGTQNLDRLRPLIHLRDNDIMASPEVGIGHRYGQATS